VTLRALKPLDPAYPKELLTVGDHIRKRRLDLGLLQRDAAERIGVDTMTLFNWEVGRVRPNVRVMPAVIQFLGYDPIPPGGTLGARLRAARMARGWSQAELAGEIGVDPSTVSTWELRGEIQWPPSREIVARFLRGDDGRD